MAEHAARGARTQRISVSRAEAGGLTQERGSGSAAELLMGLQRAAGNRAVARLVSPGGAIPRELIIGGWPGAPGWSDQPSLHEIIRAQAKTAHIPPKTVRPELLVMSGARRHGHHTSPPAV